MSHRVSVADVDVYIEGQGPETIVMIHGWPDTYRLWDAQVEALKDGYRCVRFTLPGFDVTQRPKAYSLDELIGFLKQLIEQLCPGQRVILMLHDWGCLFGYAFYMRHPQRVSKIISVDIGDPVSWWQSLTPREALMIFTFQIGLALVWVIGGQIGDRITRSIARRVRCPSDPAYIHSCMNYPYFLMWLGGRQSYRHQVQRFLPACPILFIYGRRKPIPFHAKAWTEVLQTSPANQVVEFNTGHWVMSEQAEQLNQTVSRWLSQIP